MNIPGGIAIVAIGASVGAAGVWALRSSAAPLEQSACMDDDTRERVRGILLDGIDAALKAQAQHIFTTWMKDPTDQPRRATIGMRNGVNAYVGSRAAAKKWTPPHCRED
jgi:hypothetical protein